MSLLYFTNLLDNFSFRPHLYIKSQERYKSLFVAILGLVTYLTSIIMGSYFFFDTLKQDKPQVVMGESSDIYPIVNLSESVIQLSLTQGQDPVYDPSIFSIRVMYLYYFVSKDGNLSTIKSIANEYPVEKCDNVDFGIYENYKGKNSYCIMSRKNNLTLYGYYGDIRGQKFLNIYLNRCVNTTDNPVRCKSPAFIENYLNNVFLYLSYENHNLNNFNRNPFIKEFNNIIFPFSSTIYKRYFLKLTNIIYKTDFGLIFEDYETVQNYVTGLYETNVDLKVGTLYNPSAFGQITISCDQKSLIFSRSYTKLQSVVANIGGALKAFQTFTLILANIITEKAYFQNLINLIFHYDNTTTENIKEKTNTVGVFIDNRLNKFQIPIEKIKKKNDLSLKLSFSEIICPTIFWKSNRKKIFFGTAVKKLKEDMSYENLIFKIYQFENFKNLLFDENQLYVFDNIPRKSPLENKKDLKYSNLKLNDFQQDEIVQKMKKIFFKEN